MSPTGRSIFSTSIFLAVLFGASCVLFFSTPLSIRTGEWGHSVLENWHDYGFFALKGELAHNAGGNGLPSHPDIYSGHRAYGLYPAYFVDWIFNDCDTGLAFFLFFSTAIGVSTWVLLGRGAIATITAISVVCSPAFVRMTPTLDLFDVPVLFGIPFLFRVRELLNREKLTPPSLAILFCLFIFYMPLNWTTVVALGITMVYLAVARPLNKKRFLGLIFFLGIGSAAILTISVASKMGGEGGSKFSSMFNHYLFGPGGYDGKGMSWSKACMRLTVVNTVALLPLWLVLFWKIRRVVKSKISKQLYLSLSPLLAAIFFIALLRNYFAHHPWMAGPVFIYGIVFSLRLLLDNQPESSASSAQIFLRSAAPAFLGFAYTMIIMAWLNVNAAGVSAFLHLIRENTPRSSIIFYSPDDSSISRDADRFASIIDRKLVPLTRSNPQEWQNTSAEKFQLTSNILPQNQKWLARTKIEDMHGVIGSTLNWYRNHIAKRAAGDRLEISGDLYLYKMP